MILGQRKGLEEQMWEEEEHRDVKLKFGNFEANSAGESAGPGEVPQETSEINGLQSWDPKDLKAKT